MLAALKGVFHRGIAVSLWSDANRSGTEGNFSADGGLIPRASISTLPDELIHHIARCTDDSFLLALAAVSRRFYPAARRSTLWECLSDTQLCLLPRLLDTSPSLQPHFRHLHIEAPTWDVGMVSPIGTRWITRALELCSDLRSLDVRGLPFDSSSKSLVAAIGRHKLLGRLRIRGGDTYCSLPCDTFLAMLLSNTQLRQLDTFIEAPSPRSPPFSTSIPLTHLTLNLTGFNDAALLEIANATFGALVSLDLTLLVDCTVSKQGAVAAFGRIPSELAHLSFSTGILQPSFDIRPLLPRFHHLTSIMLDIERDLSDIVNFLPPTLRSLELVVTDLYLGRHPRPFLQALFKLLNAGGLPSLEEVFIPGGTEFVAKSEMTALRKVTKRRGIRRRRQ